MHPEDFLLIQLGKRLRYLERNQFAMTMVGEEILLMHGDVEVCVHSNFEVIYYAAKAYQLNQES